MVSTSLREEMSKFSVQAESSRGICLKEAYFYSFFFLPVYIYRLFSFLLKSRKHILPRHKNCSNPFILSLSFVDA